MNEFFAVGKAKVRLFSLGEVVRRAFNYLCRNSDQTEKLRSLIK